MSTPPQVPLEIVSKIVILLPPVRCFQICVQLRLTYCYRHCIPHIPCMSLDESSNLGRVSVLDWWKQSGLPLKYTDLAMKWASNNGHVAILEWWKQSGLVLKYDGHAMSLASFAGQVAVLEWWKQSGLPLKYGYIALELAAIQGHGAILEWWKQSGLFRPGMPFDPKPNLEWWKHDLM